MWEMLKAVILPCSLQEYRPLCVSCLGYVCGNYFLKFLNLADIWVPILASDKTQNLRVQRANLYFLPRT